MKLKHDECLLQGADRQAAVQVEPPFERPLYLRGERRVFAETVSKRT